MTDNDDKTYKVEFGPGVEAEIDAMPEEARERFYREVFKLQANPQIGDLVDPADVPPELIDAVRELHPELSVDEILAQVRYLDL